MVILKIEKTSVQKNPFLGLFFKTNDEITLCPKNVPLKNEKEIERVLRTKVVQILIEDSPLIGLFAALNDNGLILPDFTDEETVSFLKKETGFNLFFF